MGRRKRKPLPILEKVVIDNVAAEGKAITRVDDMVVFVPQVAPGDIVDIQITKRKKTYLEGKAIKFHSYSDIRTEPFCSHFGLCGGCKWQHLPYKEQIHYKQQQVLDSMERIAGLPNPEIDNILPSANTQYYRNKLEYTFSNRRWLAGDEPQYEEGERNMNGLGFHIPRLFDRIVDIEHCYLQESPSNEIRLFVRKFALERKLEFYDVRNHEGLLRNLILRNNTENEWMVILSITSFTDDIKDLFDELITNFPQIVSLYYVENTKKNDDLSDQDMMLYHGAEWLTAKMEDLKFRVGPKSFYQTNSDQAYVLYQQTRELAGLTGEEMVYDLYTGTGTIAQFVAAKAKKVVGVEYIPEAIEDAKMNAALNNIENCDFYAGDMAKVLTPEFISEHGKPDVIITDPPRAGMHPKVVEAIVESGVNRIVYVSCNPATQARDISMLKDLYKVVKIQPVDMFPHTHHVENIALLEKK